MPPRRGFTLVELLTVVVIIGILAALITAAAIKAKDMAKTTAMKMEISQMALALEAFKQQFGDYPPDGTNALDTGNFIRRAFPRFTSDANVTISGSSATITGLSPTTALIFWLGGGTDSSGNYRWLSANPADPFDGNQSRIGAPPFDFDRTRVGNSNQFYPNNGTGTTMSPYVYFKALNTTYTGSCLATGSGTGSVTPFVDTRLNNTYVNPRSFQILCPGLDGIFGTALNPSQYPLPTPTPAQNALPEYRAYYDDITNFSNGKLESDMNN